MNNENETEVLNQNGEETGVLAPSNFGDGLAFINPADIPDLETAEIGMNIQPESFEFKNEGEKLRGVFVGFTIFNVKDRMNEGKYIPKKTAVIQTKQGFKTNMGANLVKQLESIPAGNAIEITYKGEQRTGNNNKVKSYEIHLLNVKVPNVSMPLITKTVEVTEAKSNQPVYRNMDKKDEYWRMVSQVKLTNEEGNDHLKEFHYDFAAALEALTPGFVA
jgi:hypothetical protein